MASTYRLIEKGIILAAKKGLSCPLYKKKKDGSFYLFCDVPATKADHQRILTLLEAKEHIGDLFIKKSDQELYRDFLRESVNVMIESESFSVEEKTRVLREHAVTVMSAIFENPRSGTLRKVQSVVDGIVKVTIVDPHSSRLLMGLSGKDYYTFTHCINVAVFCIGLLRHFGYDDNDMLKKIGNGAILHDIGKTKIPDSILKKPGKLTPEEFAIIKKHPRYGADLMSSILPTESLEVVLYHHEKISGQGYPCGLKEDQIPFFARVAAVADVYDALTTNRSYATARKPIDALMIMKDEMLNHFNDTVFENFIKMLGPRRSALKMQ